jgi:predicted acetyltransferase
MAGAPETLRLFQTVGLSSAGALLRLVDVEAAFALHPAPAQNRARGRIGLEIRDASIAAQNGSFDVSFGARGARIAPGRTARDRLTLDVAQLAQVYASGAKATTLHRQGLVSGSVRAAEALDEAFAGPPTYLLPMNGF